MNRTKKRLALCCGVSLLLAGLSGPVFAAGNKGLQPEARLPFDAFGIPPLSANFLSAGSSVLTVNFVDESHLLITFGSRGLVPRTPNDPEGDQDRLVTAELVELPAGKVLTRTQWHLHDHGRYVWTLGDGRFLLRIQQELFTFAPLANLEHGPWARTPFPHRAGVLQAVQVAADNRLLTVMTAPAHPPPPVDPMQPARAVNITGSGDVVDRTAGYVFMDFYRMAGKGTAGSPLEIRHAGVVRSPEAIRLPVDAEGYLRSRKGARGGWDVSFESFEGAAHRLAPVGSACPPILTMTSRAQLLAFTCRGGLGADSVTLQAYDFAGHEMWEEPIGEVPSFPTFVFAAEVGRFAMSRLLPVVVPPPGGDPQQPSPPVQELRVYQMQSGDLLLKVNVSPTFRTAENYDLSPDATRVVVVHEGELDLYRLPELSKADREDLEDVRHMRPAAEGRGPINLRKLAEDDAQAAPLQDAEGPVAPPVAASTAAAPDATPASAPGASAPTALAEGDVAPRKPPTLLKPGESPDFKGGTGSSPPK